MTTTPPGDQRDAAGRYEIRLGVRLEPRWADRFDGLSLLPRGDGTTVIHGYVADQAALHGVLQRVRDLGLPLICVVRIDPTSSTNPRRPT